MKFLDGLALLLIAFKITNIIDISWVWVLSPIWIPMIILGIAKTIIQYKVKKYGNKAKEKIDEFINSLGEDE